MSSVASSLHCGHSCPFPNCRTKGGMAVKSFRSGMTFLTHCLEHLDNEDNEALIDAIKEIGAKKSAEYRQQMSSRASHTSHGSQKAGTFSNAALQGAFRSANAEYAAEQQGFVAPQYVAPAAPTNDMMAQFAAFQSFMAASQQQQQTMRVSVGGPVSLTASNLAVHNTGPPPSVSAGFNAPRQYLDSRITAEDPELASAESGMNRVVDGFSRMARGA